MRAKDTEHQTYQAAKEYLTANPDEIEKAWGDPFDALGGSLFIFCTPDGTMSSDCRGGCACLTQIKDPCYPSIPGLPEDVSDRLLQQIRADDRIPDNVADITVDNLSAFVEFQEQLDAAYAAVPKSS